MPTNPISVAVREGSQLFSTHGNRFGFVQVKDGKIHIEIWSRDPSHNVGYSFWFCQVLDRGEEDRAVEVLTAKIGLAGTIQKRSMSAEETARVLGWTR